MTHLANLPTIRRPREKLREQGVESLSIVEALAVILGSGSASKDALSLAAEVAEVLKKQSPGFTDLLAVSGVGAAKAAQVLAAIQLSHLLSYSSSSKFGSPSDIATACEDLLSEEREHLVVFYLNSRLGRISRETISIGTASASLVHPREVFRPAITHNASSIVLAHNHPSGEPFPSQADLEVTSQLSRAGKCVDITLLDHVICAKEGFFSLKEGFPDLFLPAAF
jgi:DNA repair protein RadC